MSSIMPDTCIFPMVDKCSSEMITQKVLFSWTVKNFSFSESLITSRKFPSHDNRYKWILQIEPKRTTDCKEHISASIAMTDYEKNNVFAKCFFKLSDSRGALLFRQTREHTFSKSVPWKHYCFCQRKVLLANLSDDILVIEVELTYSPGMVTISLSGEAPETDSLAQLSIDFAALYENSEYSDVTIRGNDTDVRAHRNVLAARSPVFADMFQNHTGEKETECIDISDIESETLRALISFMYSGKTPQMNEKLAKALLMASDKYAVENLKQICSSYLASSIDSSNAVELMLFAGLHSASDLKNKAMKFISDSRSSFDFSKHRTLLEQNSQVMFQILEEISRSPDSVSFVSEMQLP